MVIQWNVFHKGKAMKARQKKWIVALVTGAVVGLVGMQSMATAGPGGSLKGSATIKGNEANDVLTKGGASGGAKVFGLFGGGGGKGMRDADTLVQGVNVVGTEIDADIAILDNKVSKITNDAARVNLQGVSVRK